MKRVVLFAVVLTLTAGLAWAEPPTETAPPDAPLFLVEEGGGCTLPNTAGMSDDDRMAALLESGFEIAPSNQQVQMCPTTFRCSSLTNCGKSTQCTLTNIGQCCQTSSGHNLCCVNGPIIVERCKCKCTAMLCLVTCPQSTNVRLIC